MFTSGPIAGFPNEKNESRDQPNHDEHPVLAFETQKGETLNEKLHCPGSLFVQDKRFGGGKYIISIFLLNRAARGLGTRVGRRLPSSDVAQISPWDVHAGSKRSGL